NVQVKISVPIARHDKFVFKVGLGLTDDDYFLKNYILSTDTADNTKFRHFVAGFKREYNTLDNLFLPTEGIFSKVNIQYVKGKENFTAGNKREGYEDYERNHSWLQINMTNRFYYSVNKRLSLGLTTKIFYSYQDLFYNKKSSLLNAGMFYPTIETMTSFFSEYRSTQYVAAGMENIFKLGRFFLGNLQFRLGGFVFAPVRQILENNQMQPYYGEFFSKAYVIGSGAFIFSTRLGNLSLALSYHQRDDENVNPWNISFSFGTIIFNDKNIDR
ncbi:MAG: hypothetical protein IJ748_00855, partial [Bacteroidales bacterium]|nr:hypothetical protein [Bacteroidales bacterium]